MKQKILPILTLFTFLLMCSTRTLHAEDTNAAPAAAAAEPASTDPKADPGGIATGMAADAQDASGTHFVVSAPADLSPEDKSDTNKVATFNANKKAFDDYTAQAKLEPLERAVYLLKEVFDFDYEALQEALDKKKDYCRQLVCRAKKKLNESTSKMQFDLPDATQLMASFRKACDMGNAEELVQTLKNDISEPLQKKS